MLPHGATRDKLATEHLCNPLPTAALQEAQEGRAVRRVMESGFNHLVAGFTPAREVVFQSVGVVDAPEMTDEY